MDAMAQAVGMWTKGLPANELTNGFQAVQERAIGFAKENAEASFALASDLAAAKDVQEVLTLQTQFAQSQIQTFASQAQELGKMMAGAMQQGMTPKR
ncbi:MAG: phasin family protein [Hyphomicrobium sp.]|nr:phasin family protein [Hyphomicrobium sp.]